MRIIRGHHGSVTFGVPTHLPTATTTTTRTRTAPCVWPLLAQDCPGGWNDQGAFCGLDACPSGYARSTPGFCMEPVPAGYECGLIDCRSLCPSHLTSTGLFCG